MSLAARIAAAPAVADPARAEEARRQLADLDPALRDLAAAAAAASRHIATLIAQEGEWLRSMAAEPPEAALAALLDIAAAEDPAALDRDLRLRRRRLALLVALADLGGVWPLETVTGALSDFADRATAAAVGTHLALERARGRLPEGPGGYFVLAMGKWGARELNYSSDVDLVCLFDEGLHPPGDYAEIRSAFVRVTQRLVRTLSAQTAEGHVFRTDLRLRPDPSSTPVCIGAGVAEAYYEGQGRTWERAAMIKARPVAGDLAAGDRFLRALAPFVWRRHLDFAAIEDVHDLQRRIRDHKGLHGPLQAPGHDVKLGRGGIRAIEFFVQTRQLICGGRDPALRLRATLPALAALAERGWVMPDPAEALAADYRALRALEHRIQMLDDAQTHTIPKAEAARRRLAALCGLTDLAAFEAREVRRFERVHALTEPFFLPGGGARPLEEVTPERLAALGYRRPDHARALLDRWLGGTIPATRSARARAILRRIAPEMFQRLGRAASPDDAVTRFDAFLSGLPAGVQILSLFEANPDLLDLLAEICAASPRLAAELSRHAGVLDAVLDRGFLAPLPPEDALAASLAAILAEAGDHERVLDAARRWTHEQVFRAGVRLLRGIARAEEAGEAFAALAGACLRALLPHVVAQLARRYGTVPGQEIVLLGMGKLGSREMTISSDLDLIVIYRTRGATESDGPRRLAVTAWFARFTQGLVAALTAPTAEGRLWEVDMRLRPSGRQGPVAVSLAAFASYHRSEAWTWEHMALTRARVVAGDAALAREVEAVIAEVRSRPRDQGQVLADAREMRERLARAHGTAAGDLWEVKQGPGGMLEIELLVQAGLLVAGIAGPRRPREALPHLARAGFLTEAEAARLDAALALQGIVQHHARLAMEGRFSPEAAGEGLVRALTRAAGVADLAALADRLGTLTAEAAAIVARRLGG